MQVNLSIVFRIAALVVFIITALLAFGLGTVSLSTVVGLVAVGLACWVASTIVP